MDWSSLKLNPLLISAVDQFKFDCMTPVQAATIPLMLDHKDVAVEAVTGSGKTLAFLLPTIQILLRREETWKKHEVGAIIIAPTRELAIQISSVLEILMNAIPQNKKLQKLSYILMIGGTQIQADIDKFSTSGGNIIIATPGRLEDVLLRRTDTRVMSAVKTLEVLILDEADCLLNLGFEQCLNNILRILPKQRRTGLFSATQTTEVLKLIRAGLRNPVSVVVRDKMSADNELNARVPSSLENYYAIIPSKFKLFTLLNFILEESDKKILIFFSTCACVEYFTYLLKYFIKKLEKGDNLSASRTVTSIHGKMKEKIRHKTFESFKNLTSGIMCATDLLARGIDITERIHWVIQFDPPSNPASFIHRSGRTARAGNNGQAVLFLQPTEQDYVEYIRISQKVTVEEFNLYDKYSSDTTIAKKKKKPESGHGCKITSKSLHGQIQQLQLDDRAIYDKAMRAFVSYYKSYSKYECNLLLRCQDLELAEIAYSFGLIKFPRISELHGKKPGEFIEVENIDLNSIPYKDKIREESRKRKLVEFNETGKWPIKSSTTEGIKIARHQRDGKAWSVANEKKMKKREKAKSKKLNVNSGLTQQEFEDLEKSVVFNKKIKQNL